MPAVVVTGARQTGKTTLAQGLEAEGWRYRTLDDPDILDAVRRDPESVLAGPGPMALDEVQRAPDLLHAVKLAIDRDRRPGRFLLTGSANLLLMRRVSESLAGRASYLALRPMTRQERSGKGVGGLWEELIETPGNRWLDLLAAQPDEPEDWRSLAQSGVSPRRRSIWSGTMREPSGATGMSAPIWSATSRTFPRFRRWSNSAA